MAKCLECGCQTRPLRDPICPACSYIQSSMYPTEPKRSKSARDERLWHIAQALELQDMEIGDPRDHVFACVEIEAIERSIEEQFFTVHVESLTQELHRVQQEYQRRNH